MPELRKDPITGRWVIISTERRKRPDAFRVEHLEPIDGMVCPFCEGQEEYTPREVLSYRRNGGAANGPGWDVRVVPNKFPALQVEGELDRHGEGLFDKMNGIGAHEVIIETPDHKGSLATLPATSVERVLWAFRERVLDLKQDKRFRYILIFKNHGAAARVRDAGADPEGDVAAHEPRAGVAAVQPDHPQRAVHRVGARLLSLARRDHAEADQGGRFRVGKRLLHQPDGAGRSRRRPSGGRDLAVAGATSALAVVGPNFSTGSRRAEL